jgi:hypothetical protein
MRTSENSVLAKFALLYFYEVGCIRYRGVQEMTQQLKDKGEDEREMTMVRALLGVLAVLVSLAFAAGCGLVSDQTKQEAK